VLAAGNPPVQNNDIISSIQKPSGRMAGNGLVAGKPAAGRRKPLLGIHRKIFMK
jgi:hypothetical protein